MFNVQCSMMKVEKKETLAIDLTTAHSMYLILLNIQILCSLFTDHIFVIPMYVIRYVQYS